VGLTADAFPKIHDKKARVGLFKILQSETRHGQKRALNKLILASFFPFVQQFEQNLSIWVQTDFH